MTLLYPPVSYHAGNLLSHKATDKLSVVASTCNLGIQAEFKLETSLPRTHNVILSQKQKLQVLLWCSTQRLIWPYFVKSLSEDEVMLGVKALTTTTKGQKFWSQLIKYLLHKCEGPSLDSQSPHEIHISSMHLSP